MPAADRPEKSSAGSPVDGRSTRWAAHRTRRREEIVDSALVVLGREGRDFGLDQVAVEAGVTKPVIYRHFGDRGALIDAMADRATNLLVERLVPLVYVEGPPVARIRSAMDEFLRFLDGTPNVSLLFRRRLPGQNDEAVDAGRELVAQALTGVIGGYADALGLEEPAFVKVWSQSLVGAAQATAEWWLTTREVERDVVVEHLTTLVWIQIEGVARRCGIAIEPDVPFAVTRRAR
ncbi:TetR/AcrR family transcriptional regulator [Pseudonocardia sp. HH130630-07]|uniref:TetR/AcrR family transcriptional regulator n=1 Tax=Pseudonocardia sp. HH130630-07 TaxID=1690815 RepID=UPI000814DD5F|nr:TetR/AcrR family transcriptional regulator [Pseudonocardia sp. HH130630-07]ANY06470.1 hypothetical protein AFB00_09390 [Pseudonocardia sp. HH130630-07]